MRVAYIVSRFPDPSETFVLRELNGVDGLDGTELELFALFPPKARFVHPDAERWVGRVHRATPTEAVVAMLGWLRDRPSRLLGALALVVRGYGRDPERLARALVTFGAGAAHARTMRQLRIEHVHAHFATYPALAAWLAGRLLDVPYSFTAHAHDIYVDQLNLGTLVGEASAVVPISEYNRAFLARYGAGTRTPAPIVRCGVDPAAYPFRPRTVPREGTVRALCVATLNELKGHATLFEALATGDPGLRRIELDMVGDGPLEGSLRTLADRLGIANRVRFLGTRSEPEVTELLGRADLFVLASVVMENGRMDGIPVALMEALAAGVPVIASRLSGIPELVRDGETGVLAQPGDSADLVAALHRVLADPEATLARTRAGRTLVEREFDIGRSSERMVAIFEQHDHPVERAQSLAAARPAVG